MTIKLIFDHNENELTKYKTNPPTIEQIEKQDLNRLVRLYPTESLYLLFQIIGVKNIYDTLRRPLFHNVRWDIKREPAKIHHIQETIPNT